MDVRLKKYPKTIAKIVMTVGMFLLALLTVVSLFMTAYLIYQDFYTSFEEDLIAAARKSITQEKTLDVYNEYISVEYYSKNEATCSQDYKGKTNFRYRIVNLDTGETFGTYTEGIVYDKSAIHVTNQKDFDTSYSITGYMTPNEVSWFWETYNFSEFMISTLYSLRFVLPFLTILAFAGVCILSVLLIRSVGHRNGAQEVTLSRLDRIPFEAVLLALTVLPVMLYTLIWDFGLYRWMLNTLDYFVGDFNYAFMNGFLILGVFTLFYIFSYTAAARYKSRTLWTNTLIYRLFCPLKKLLRRLNYAGHRNEAGELVPTWFDKIPLEIIILALFPLFLLSLYIGNIFFDYFSTDLVAYIVLILCFAAILYGFAYAVSVRIQLGTLWTNTIAYCLRRKLSGTFPHLCNTLPLTWRTAVVTLAVIGFVLIDFGYALFNIDYPIAVVFVVLLVLVLLAVFVLLLYSSWATHAITEIIRDMANGNINRKTDTSRFFFIFKQQAEGLNSLGDGLQAAVQAQMKSERFKTELITNVSHDIKTPLTSIINYADLLLAEFARSQTPPDGKAGEYADVIYRHSLRLKKLTEDLLEASKASSGTINVEFERLELNQMLRQAVGEYEERLNRGGLTPVFRFTNEDVYLSADGKLLWRVFDNLLSNIVKYSLPGTRVYVTLTKDSGRAVVSFKNISRETLDMATEELLERFIRGDASRHSEGSGLGLNIAQSLCDLMHGKLDLACDGDLFRADVTFPVIE